MSKAAELWCARTIASEVKGNHSMQPGVFIYIIAREIEVLRNLSIFPRNRPGPIDLLRPLKKVAGPVGALAAAARTQLFQKDPESRPHAHPELWAAFVLAGQSLP